MASSLNINLFVVNFVLFLFFVARTTDQTTGLCSPWRNSNVESSNQFSEYQLIYFVNVSNGVVVHLHFHLRCTQSLKE